MCCVHFYYVTIYLCSGLFGCDVQKEKLDRRTILDRNVCHFQSYCGLERYVICQSLSLIHVHLVHKHVVANNELNQSFSPRQ